MRAIEKAREKCEEVEEEYGGGEGMPLRAFRGVSGAFSAAVLASLYALNRRDRLPDDVPVKDLALLCLASHKLARLLTQDQVTAALRAPFTEYEGPRGHGAVKEKARGRGLQRAMGELFTCPYCMGVWTSATLTVGYLAAPKVGRAVSNFLCTSLAVDYLNILWARTSNPD